MGEKILKARYQEATPSDDDYDNNDGATIHLFPLQFHVFFF